MWGDKIPKEKLHKNLLIKKLFNKQYKILLKSWLYRWKDNITFVKLLN